MSDEEKIKENRLRRAAKRQRLFLTKSRRRDPRAADFGTYTLTDENSVVVAGPGLSLDEIEKSLTED